MIPRPDVEDLQITWTEKLLAVVLTAFLLLGGIWTYTQIDDVVRDHVRLPSATLEQDPTIAREVAAQQRVSAAEGRSQQALQDLELKREAYRTALEAHEPAAGLKQEYDAANAEYAAAQSELETARQELAAASPAAQEARERASDEFGAALHRQERDAFLARLALVLLTIGFAYWLLAHMRKRSSRWFPLAGSVVGFATIFAFVLASDYLTDYVAPFDWGIAVVALIGIVATLLAYLVLQRYLLRRVPQRRVRKRQCPFCGYPAGTGNRCEGCGREIVAPCASCEAPRRVGSPHCSACGATS